LTGPGRPSNDDMPQMPASGARPRDRRFVVSLARGLEILRAFNAGDGFLGNNEIAQRTGLPRPTVSRLTYTLTELGYLSHVPRFGKYQLAPGAMALGYSALAQMGIRHIARPPMQELAESMGVSVALGARDRLRVIYLQHCLSSSILTVRLDVGSRIPVATTAIGRALIATMPEFEREALFAELAERAGPDWPHMRVGIEKAMIDMAERGYALSIGEWREDVNGIGVPFVMPDGSGVYAFNCGAPAFSVSQERLENDVAPLLLDLVRQVHSIVTGRADGVGPQLEMNDTEKTTSQRGNRDIALPGGGNGRRHSA
jgi:DNA-binding IclR family transcriptional regulator